VGILAVVSFTTYAMALPGSAFDRQFEGHLAQIGGIVALLVSILLPQVAAGLRIAVKD
jgi:hypothetical protein